MKAVKLLHVILSFLIATSASAQINLEDLIGSWKVKSFVLNDEFKDPSNTYFTFSLTDKGDYILEQIHVVKPKNIICTARIIDQGAGTFTHDYFKTTAPDQPDYNFWLPVTYTYTLSDGILTITGRYRAAVLERM